MSDVSPSPSHHGFDERPQQRSIGWAVRHFLWNFLGCWPLVLVMMVGVLFTIPVSLLSVEAGYRQGLFFFRQWCRWTLRGFGVRVWVVGLENIDPKVSYIVCPNHRSHFDVPILGWTLPLQVVSVHKKSLEYIPFIGQALWMSRSVGLNRNDKTDAHRRLQVVKQRLSTGRSVVIFPEGRRGTGPTLDVFRKGAAVVACEQNAPVLPVTVLGSDVIYPPNHLMVHRGDALVIIHPPIETNGLSLEDRDALTQRIKDVVARPFFPGVVPAERLAGARRVV